MTETTAIRKLRQTSAYFSYFVKIYQSRKDFALMILTFVRMIVSKWCKRYTFCGINQCTDSTPPRNQAEPKARMLMKRLADTRLYDGHQTKNSKRHSE